MLTFVHTKLTALTVAVGARLILLKTKVPKSKPKPIPGLSHKANVIIGALTWIGLIAGVAATIVAGISLMFAFHRGEFGEKAKGLVGVCVGVMIIGSASAVVKFFL